MSAPNYTDAMGVPGHPCAVTVEKHTGTADPNDDITYWQALWWLSRSQPLVGPTFLLIWLFGMEWVAPGQRPVPSSATQLAVFAVAVAAAAGMAWLSVAWQKRRNPERYAACSAVVAAERARFWACLRIGRRAADPEVTAQSSSGFWGFDRRNVVRGLIGGLMAVVVAVFFFDPTAYFPVALALSWLLALFAMAFPRIAAAYDRREVARRSARMATRPRVAERPAVAAERRRDSEVPDMRRGR